MRGDDAAADVLARLSDAQLEALAAKCEAHTAPTGARSGRRRGIPSAVDAVDALASAWRLHPGLTGAGVALSLRSGLRARRGPDSRGARPAWTGPETIGEQRLTAAVLHERPSRPFGTLAGINRWCRPTEQRDVGSVMHAKLLVIDGRQAFIGSANLTHRALHANLESGLLVNDADVAAEFEGHLRHLMTTGVLRRDKTS